MGSSGEYDIEKFFQLFHEPFILWIEDLEAIVDKNLFEAEFTRGYRDTLLLHYANLIDQLCNLLATQYKFHYSLPVPSGTRNADELRVLFRRLGLATQNILNPKLVVRLEVKTIERLRWIVSIDLDKVLRERGTQ